MMTRFVSGRAAAVDSETVYTHARRYVVSGMQLPCRFDSHTEWMKDFGVMFRD